MSPLAFVINLDRAPERLAHFTAQARAAGIAFERLPAFDAGLMTSAECAAWVDPSAIYALSNAEIGCIRSHRLAWERIASSGAAWGAVFEDDACLSHELASILADSANAPEAVDIIKLEATGGRKISLARRRSSLAGRDLRQLRGLAVGSAGYLISNRACRKLLGAPRRYSVPLDVYLFSQRHGACRDLNVHVLTPAPVIQSDKHTTASTEGVLASLICQRGKTLHPRPAISKRIKRELQRLQAQLRSIGAERVAVDWR